MLIDSNVMMNGQNPVAGTVHHLHHHVHQTPPQSTQHQQSSNSAQLNASSQILNTLLSSNSAGTNPFLPTTVTSPSNTSVNKNNTNPFLNAAGNPLECSPVSQELLAQQQQGTSVQTIQCQQHDKRKPLAQVTSMNEILESIQKPEHFPSSRHRWNTNEEIAGFLLALDRHDSWLSHDVKNRPKSGSMMLYSRKRVRYRRDGYCWKKRKDGKTTREDHMKLKVQSIECIYGCYVHSAILPTFHRRCYWLLQNPDIVLVHYLNVPYNDDTKVITTSANVLADTRREWTRDDIFGELRPMFYENIEDYSDSMEEFSIDHLEPMIQRLMVTQRAHLKAFEESNLDPPMAKASTIFASLIGGTTGNNNNNNSIPSVTNNCSSTKASPPPTSSSSSSSSHYGTNSQVSKNTANNSSSSKSSHANVVAPTLHQNMQSNTNGNTQPNAFHIVRASSANNSNTLQFVQITSGGSIFIVKTETTSQGHETLFQAPPSSCSSSSSAAVSSSATNNNNLASLPSPSDEIPTTVLEHNPRPSPIQPTLQQQLQPQDQCQQQQQHLTNEQTHHPVKMELDDISTTFASNAMDENNFEQIFAGHDLMDSLDFTHQLMCSAPPSPNLNQLARSSHSDLSAGGAGSIDFLDESNDVVMNSDEILFGLDTFDLFDHFMSDIHDPNGPFVAPNSLAVSNHHNSSSTNDSPTMILDSAGNSAATTPASADSSVSLPLPSTSSSSSVGPPLFGVDRGTQLKTPYTRRNTVALEHQASFTNSVTNSGQKCGSITSIVSRAASAGQSRSLLSFDAEHYSIGGMPSSMKPIQEQCRTRHASNIEVSQQILHSNMRIGQLQCIADYSPEWCYPEGNIKVLIAGPWTLSSTIAQSPDVAGTLGTRDNNNGSGGECKYCIHFGAIIVAAELVQSGLLRCYSPKHEPGLVQLQVSCNSVIVSNAVLFEYRARSHHASQSALSVASNDPNHAQRQTFNTNNSQFDSFAFDEKTFKHTRDSRLSHHQQHPNGHSHHSSQNNNSADNTKNFQISQMKYQEQMLDESLSTLQSAEHLKSLDVLFKFLDDDEHNTASLDGSSLTQMLSNESINLLDYRDNSCSPLLNSSTNSSVQSPSSVSSGQLESPTLGDKDILQIFQNCADLKDDFDNLNLYKCEKEAKEDMLQSAAAIVIQQHYRRYKAGIARHDSLTLNRQTKLIKNRNRLSQCYHSDSEPKRFKHSFEEENGDTTNLSERITDDYDANDDEDDEQKDAHTCALMEESIDEGLVSASTGTISSDISAVNSRSQSDNDDDDDDDDDDDEPTPLIHDQLTDDDDCSSIAVSSAATINFDSELDEGVEMMMNDRKHFGIKKRNKDLKLQNRLSRIFQQQSSTLY